MGKYTSLARQLREEEHSKEVLGGKSVKMNTMSIDTGSHTPDRPDGGTTPLRPYAVNAVVRCIHGKASEECAVCSGYARWLMAGGSGRIEKARRNPEAAPREFWRAVLGEEA